jgi:hypothetical protein
MIAGGFGSTGLPLRVMRGVKELWMTLQPLRQLRLAQLPLRRSLGPLYQLMARTRALA